MYSSLWQGVTGEQTVSTPRRHACVAYVPAGHVLQSVQTVSLERVQDAVSN